MNCFRLQSQLLCRRIADFRETQKSTAYSGVIDRLEVGDGNDRRSRRRGGLDRPGELPEDILPRFNRLSDLLFLPAGWEENANR
jgi:hypothetical protein